jgi:glycosyltransferase involved in cell wall biosynthesis
MTFLPPNRRPSAPAGAIDWPRPGAVEPGVVEIGGWVLFPSSPTARVEVLLDGKPLGRARLGSPRPDIAAAWEPKHAGISGFGLSADLTDWDAAGGEASLLAVATSSAGERHELGPVALTPVPRPDSPSASLPSPAAPRPAASAGERPRVLVYTHQLLLGGAQLYLNDLLRQMAGENLAELTVVSPVDGPLRDELEGFGIAVHVSSPVPDDALDSYLGRVEELTAWARDREFDVALVNTATTLSFPGAEVAERLGIPLVWVIHESMPPPVLWSSLIPEVQDRAEAAMSRASFLVFEAEATQRLFEPFVDPSRCLMLPYGLDLKPIETARRSFDKGAARREADIPADAEVIVCIGTVEPRKAQVLLAQAFGQIADRHPRAHLFFVGGRDDVESRTLEQYIESAGLTDRVKLIPITPDVQPWYGLADFLVCASDLESLPRTVLEAMAWETPVLATDVFGVSELIVDGETGWLCEPRDLDSLSTGLDRMLRSAPEQRQVIGSASRSLVEDRHRLDRYCRQIADLLERATKSGADRRLDA